MVLEVVVVDEESTRFDGRDAGEVELRVHGEGSLQMEMIGKQTRWVQMQQKT